jgi:hypothetical protein
MKHDDHPLESMLRDSLGRQADRGTGAGPDLGGVLGRAKVIRRHRRQGAALAAAAAVAAIAVPSAILLGGSPKAAPPVPSHENTSTIAPSPDATPDPSKDATARYATLKDIPLGADATVGYLDLDGMVHDQGQTTRLPGNSQPVTTFHDFRGGWVVGRDLKLTQYDASGNVVRTGDNTSIKVSDDHVELAWQSGRTVFYGPNNTMGEGGPAEATAPDGETLIGFLSSGPALGADQRVSTMDKDGRFVTQHVPLFPMSASQTSNLIGGSVGRVPDDDFAGAVYDMATQTLLWHNKWNPVAFSSDGKYVAGYPIYDNGDPFAWAILDARTGHVVARTPQLKNVYLGLTVAWQDDDTLVMTGDDGHSGSLLTLRTDGSFARAGQIVAHANGKNAFRFIAQP